MIAYLKKLFSLCEHKWSVVREIELFTYSEDTMPSGKRFILQCDKCGNMKSKTFR